MPSPPAHREIVYYDGDCGLCHRLVRWILPRDPAGHFAYAPLQGETIERRLSAEQRRGLPDSVVVETADGRLLTHSTAAVHILRRLRSGWPAFGRTLGWIPRPLRDAGYNFIARVRSRLFAHPGDRCPTQRPEWRDRLLP